jgi:D-alanyl-D-alanine carboxypeptidase
MKKTILVLILLLFLPASISASTKSNLIQRIEILRHEVSLLRMLVANMRINQGITAPAYIAFTDTVLLEKNSEKPYPIASITKLMTSVIALENIDKNQRITLTAETLKPLGQSPVLFLGLNTTAENLVKANLIQSSNDASEALAIHLGKEKFIGLMNQKAKEIGMKRTFFHDAHGLDSRNQSTAQDLAKLLEYIHRKHPEILLITRDNDFWMPNSSGNLLKFQNVNNFYYIPSFIGGKTGYLPEAKQTIASVFNVNGKPTFIVVLYSNNRQADVFAILRSLR